MTTSIIILIAVFVVLTLARIPIGIGMLAGIIPTCCTRGWIPAWLPNR